MASNISFHVCHKSKSTLILRVILVMPNCLLWTKSSGTLSELGLPSIPTKDWRLLTWVKALFTPTSTISFGGTPKVPNFLFVAPPAAQSFPLEGTSRKPPLPRSNGMFFNRLPTGEALLFGCEAGSQNIWLWTSWRYWGEKQRGHLSVCRKKVLCGTDDSIEPFISGFFTTELRLESVARPWDKRPQKNPGLQHPKILKFLCLFAWLLIGLFDCCYLLCLLCLLWFVVVAAVAVVCYLSHQPSFDSHFGIQTQPESFSKRRFLAGGLLTAIVEQSAGLPACFVDFALFWFSFSLSFERVSSDEIFDRLPPPLPSPPLHPLHPLLRPLPSPPLPLPPFPPFLLLLHFLLFQFSAPCIGEP